MFPAMEMRIRGEGHAFLRQMKTVADEQGFETKIKLEEPSELYCSVLAFSPKEPQVHEELVGYFVHWAHRYPRIDVQVTARWELKGLTYGIVRTAAEGLFKPLISAYNRRHSSRYRLRIESPEEMLPKLSPEAQDAFNRFVHSANLKSLHPHDWRRFYQFVKVCHATRNDVDESEIGFLLRKAGFANEYAGLIAQIFVHCRDFHVQSDSRRERSYNRRRFRRRGESHDD